MYAQYRFSLCPYISVYNFLSPPANYECYILVHLVIYYHLFIRFFGQNFFSTFSEYDLFFSPHYVFNLFLVSKSFL